MTPRSNKQPSAKTTKQPDSLGVHLASLELMLGKAKSDSECKEAIWHWLSGYDLYMYYWNEKRKNEAEAIIRHVFKEVNRCCNNLPRQMKLLPTFPKFEQTWNKAIKRFEKEANQLHEARETTHSILGI